MNNMLAPQSAIVGRRARDAAPAETGRLLILVPDDEFDEAGLTRAIWSMADQGVARALLLTAIADWAREPQALLRLALMAALLRESGLEAEIELTLTSDWLAAARERLLTGDTIVCLAEHRISDSANPFAARQQPIASYLAALGHPTHELPGPYATGSRESSTPIGAWLAPLSVVAVSFVVEVAFARFARNVAGWTRGAVLAICTAAELVSITLLDRARPGR